MDGSTGDNGDFPGKPNYRTPQSATYQVQVEPEKLEEFIEGLSQLGITQFVMLDGCLIEISITSTFRVTSNPDHVHSLTPAGWYYVHLENVSGVISGECIYPEGVSLLANLHKDSGDSL